MQFYSGPPVHFLSGVDINSTDEEKSFLDQLASWLKEETGYQWIQGCPPWRSLRRQSRPSPMTRIIFGSTR
jgi:hypothetical protein